MVYLTSWAGAPDLDLTSLRYWVASIERNLVPATAQGVVEVSHEVGLFYRYGLICVLAGLAAVVYFCSSASRFAVTQSMKTLRASEQELWHGIIPVMKENLVKADIDKGPWRMVMNPLLFVKTHQLANETVKDRKPALELIHGRARNTFTMQLGQLWESAHHLPPHLLALFVIFGARAKGDRKLADTLIEQISRSAERGRLDFSGVKMSLMKLRNCDLIAKVVYRHAYITTVMAAMLDLARCDGVLASSEFIWLKPLDRRMWYVLNDVGRQTPSVESAGVFAHLAAERKFGRPLRVPMVEEAVIGLEEALAEILYEPED